MEKELVGWTIIWIFHGFGMFWSISIWGNDFYVLLIFRIILILCLMIHFKFFDWFILWSAIKLSVDWFIDSQLGAVPVDLPPFFSRLQLFNLGFPGVEYCASPPYLDSLTFFICDFLLQFNSFSIQYLYSQHHFYFNKLF